MIAKLYGIQTNKLNTVDPCEGLVVYATVLVGTYYNNVLKVVQKYILLNKLRRSIRKLIEKIIINTT